LVGGFGAAEYARELHIGLEYGIVPSLLMVFLGLGQQSMKLIALCFTYMGMMFYTKSLNIDLSVHVRGLVPSK
jgi:hypothetical protein